MKNKLSLTVEDFSIIDDYSDSQLAIVEVYVCHDGNNLHDMPIDFDALKKAKRTLKNKFLVAGFDGVDFEGHEPDEQIVGFFPESSKMSFVEMDGRNYLVAQAIMSKVYAEWAYNVFVEDDNHRAVSMEITVLETELNDEDGLEHITKFVFNGVTLLGETHIPACEGANASIIKFSKENALQLYSKHFEKSSDKIKRDFVEGMRLAEGSGKEERENMEDKEKETVELVDEEKALEEVAEDEFEEKVDSDEDAYMEDEEDKAKEKDAEDEEDDDTDDDDEDESEEKDSKEDKNFESLTVEQKYEVFRSAVRESLNGCGYLESFDEEYLYIYDYCEGYTYRYSYVLDGTVCTIDIDSKTRVMRGGYVEFEAYTNNENELETLKNENCELKEKLAAYEVAEKEKSVEAILSEVVDVLPAEQIAELREKAVNYSLDDISIFENEVKAIAFEAMADKAKSEKYSFNRMTINTEVTKKTSKYGW